MNDEIVYYYLHSETKDLICKRTPPEMDSDFVEKVWTCDPSNRLTAWMICVEGLYLGAKLDRVKELATKWQLTPEDSLKFIARIPPSVKVKNYILNFMKQVHNMEEETYWNLMVKEAERLSGGKII